MNISKKAQIIIASVISLAVIMLMVGFDLNAKSQEEVTHRLKRLSSWNDTAYNETILKDSRKLCFERAVFQVISEYQKEETEYYRVDRTISLLAYLHYIGYENEKLVSYLHEFVLQKFDEYEGTNEIDEMVYIANLLSSGGIEDEEIRNSIQEMLKEKQNMLFVNGENEALSSLLSCAEMLGEDNYYLTIFNCLPYDETVEYVKQNAVKLITKQGRGGFYDDKTLENESYWVDPLAKVRLSRGEIGTYQYSVTNMAAGDFRVEIETKQWYQTPESDPNNQKSTSLYYKDNYFTSGYDEIREFLRIMDNNNSYFIPNAERPVFMTFAEGSITVFYTRLFTIAYS